ncbi:MAG: hypothetical protein HUU30_14770 [Burkholderiaceae bacterium]|nr:hypothetical protein [Aquabacterium sp.]NUP86998.1 hypothetical protein [Burkholderiaceae bacterium]
MPVIPTATLLRRLPPLPSGARGEQARAELVEHDLAAAAWVYRIVDIEEMASGWLTVGGERLYAPRLLPQGGRLTALGVGACTLGPRIEQRVRELFHDRRPALALALNDLGTELLFALARLAQDRLQAQAAARGLTMSGELHAGDPGLDLGAQPQVLRLAGASAIGIGTTSGAQLTPGMSGTSVHGLGIDLPPTTWSRCDGCPSAAQCRAATRRRANTAGDAQASMPLPDRAPA